MAKTRQQKEQIVKNLGDSFQQAKLIVLSEIRGLTVAETEKLRRALRAEKVGHRVVKISLLKRALRGVAIKTEAVQLATQVAVSYSDDDTAAARILHNFSKSNEKLKLLGGYADKTYIDRAQVIAVASIPPRRDLLGQLVSLIAGPLRNVTSVLSGSHRGLIQVLSRVKR